MTAISTVRRLAATAVAATAAALAVASPASATTTLASTPCVKDLTGAEYNVQLCGMPDVDQFRSGLPNNGSSYCVPTSLFNVLHYFANVVKVPMTFGPLAGLDPYNQYGTTTNLLAWTSIKAGGDPKDGSAGYGGSRIAFNDITSYAKNQGWTFASDFNYTSGSEDFGYEIAKQLARGPMQLSYKRWAQDETHSSVWNNTGSGHATTVVAAKGTVNSGEVQLLLADPGRAPDHKKTSTYLDTQSQYTYEVVTVRRVEVWTQDTPQGSGGSGTIAAPTYKKTVQWELTGPSYETWQLGGEYRLMVFGFNWFEANKPS